MLIFKHFLLKVHETLFVKLIPNKILRWNFVIIILDKLDKYETQSENMIRRKQTHGIEKVKFK